MKTASLIIGMLLMILAGAECIVFLLMPMLTNNRISFDKALVGLIPAFFLFLLGSAISLAAATLVIKTMQPAR